MINSERWGGEKRRRKEGDGDNLVRVGILGLVAWVTVTLRQKQFDVFPVECLEVAVTAVSPPKILECQGPASGCSVEGATLELGGVKGRISWLLTY